MRLVRHMYLQESATDGAVHWKAIWFRSYDMRSGRMEEIPSLIRIGSITSGTEAVKHDFNIARTHSCNEFLYTRAFQGHAGGDMITLELMGHVAIPFKWKEFLLHKGCSLIRSQSQTQDSSWEGKAKKVDKLLFTLNPWGDWRKVRRRLLEAEKSTLQDEAETLAGRRRHQFFKMQCLLVASKKWYPRKVRRLLPTTIYTLASSKNNSQKCMESAATAAARHIWELRKTGAGATPRRSQQWLRREHMDTCCKRTDSFEADLKIQGASQDAVIQIRKDWPKFKHWLISCKVEHQGAESKNWEILSYTSWESFPKQFSAKRAWDVPNVHREHLTVRTHAHIFLTAHFTRDTRLLRVFSKSFYRRSCRCWTFLRPHFLPFSLHLRPHRQHPLSHLRYQLEPNHNPTLLCWWGNSLAIWPTPLRTQVTSQRWLSISSASTSIASTVQSIFQTETWFSRKSTPRRSSVKRTYICLDTLEHQAAASIRQQAEFPLCQN